MLKYISVVAYIDRSSVSRSVLGKTFGNGLSNEHRYGKSPCRRLVFIDTHQVPRRIRSEVLELNSHSFEIL